MRSPTKAATIFAIGPIIAVIAIPTLGFLKFLGSIGTGFAQPNPNKSIHKAPIGSMWLSGLIESLPLPFTALSPRSDAVKACAHSWNGRIKI